MIRACSPPLVPSRYDSHGKTEYREDTPPTPEEVLTSTETCEDEEDRDPRDKRGFRACGLVTESVVAPHAEHPTRMTRRKRLANAERRRGGSHGRAIQSNRMIRRLFTAALEVGADVPPRGGAGFSWGGIVCMYAVDSKRFLPRYILLRGSLMGWR